MTPGSPGASGGGVLPRPDALIPHREPFLFLTELVVVEPGQSGKARWVLSGNEPFFAGHFPGRPTLPGVLMIESLAQLGAAVALSDERFEGYLPLFGGIDRARFRRQVLPGDTLELEIELKTSNNRAGTAHGVARVAGKVACECDLLFVFVRE